MTDIIAIAGPTASGKTKFAIEIAGALDGEIVSCDSMQLYKYMDIGSAKPSKEELARCRHHLVDIIDPREEMTAAKYQKLAREAIDDIAARGKMPVICGGTGLYLDSVIYDMDFAAPPDNDEKRKKYYDIAEAQGPEALYAMLEELSPEAAKRIHPNNIIRVARALEAAENGEPIADFAADLKRYAPYNVTLIGLKRDREELYKRIDDRVDELIEMGLVDEVRSLMDMGLSASDISMKGIGYKELIAHLEGEYDLEEAVRLIKRNTRHYAKRQMTWFRRYEDMRWFDLSEYNSDEEGVREIIEWLKRR